MSAREDMRSITEEQEAANEELQSANEEVVSSSEELQSINEELETTKEEIESTNQELMSMNAELQIRHDQLNEAYDYADAVLGTLREALLVLDKDMRVISANRTFYKLFKIREENTEGVLLSELASGQWDMPKLQAVLKDVKENNTSFENYEVEMTFRNIGKKFLMLNGRRLIQKFSKQEIILLAIEDKTDHFNAQTILKEREEWLRRIANNAPVMMWTSTPDGKRDFFNDTWLIFTGKKLMDEVGDGWHETIHPDDRGYSSASITPRSMRRLNSMPSTGFAGQMDNTGGS
jgi:two-component system CheB/CheR fusion protein